MRKTYSPTRVSASIPHTHEALLNVSATTGVYIYKNEGIPIYVGKAVNLKARLLSHEQNAAHDAKEAQIVEQSDSIDLLYTESELQALLLEAHLISSWKPKYNVRWRDDKSYLYIKITIKDEYPKVFLSRKEDDGSSRYFGPFGSVKSAESLLNRIRRIVHFCMQKGMHKRACFYHKIGLCDPCPNEIAQLSDEIVQKEMQQVYQKQIKTLIKILEGKTNLVFRSFKREITLFTRQQQFEQAIKVRDAMQQLEHLLRFGDLNTIENLMINRSKQSLESLKELLRPFYVGISELSRIECYDNSTLSFEHSTASMVVFTDGRVNKKEYRRFKIKEVLNNDFDMMKEVLSRRLEHKAWGEPSLIVIDGGKPQLNAIKGVLGTRFVEVYGKPPAYIGIAKNPDRLFVFENNEYVELKPDRHNLGFRLIQNLRDEAHRFAKKYHTYLRNKAQMIQ